MYTDNTVSGKDNTSDTNTVTGFIRADRYIVDYDFMQGCILMELCKCGLMRRIR